MASERPGRGLTALVVDDDASIRLLVRTVLELEGWKVIEAGEGELALLLAQQRRPDAVVLDVMLPGRDGFGILSELRQSEHGRDLAIVMLTAKSQPADIARGTRLGADQYLTKPCDPDEVADRLLFHALRRHPEARSARDPALRL
jgi:two-component system phosphate regulon response regulator PhoB